MSCFIRERHIRFSDYDPAGIVFYPQYFVMFNGLVEDWITEGIDIGYRTLIVERRVGLPTRRVEADFRSVSHFGDRVRLSLGVERLGARSMTLNLRCDAADGGELRMNFRQVIVTTSLLTHRAIDIPSDLRTAVARFAQVEP